YPRPTTPHLDALARESVLYEHVYACASWTKPSVACLFTSLYPVFHGAQTVDDVLAPDRVTLAEALRGSGYQTGAFIANPFVATRSFGLARGFDRVVQMLAQPQGVNINTLEADAADITREASAWLAQHAHRRFFLYLHSLDLHADYRPRPPFDAQFLSPERTGAERERDLYDNELAYNDRELGRLMEALKREGLYDRTLVAVTADHGEEFGEHGTFRHGRSLYDSLLHVPLLLKLPGSRHGGRRVAALASNIDIAPTVLAAAGLPGPAGFRGSVLPLAAADGSEAPSERRYVFAEQLSPKEVLYAARDARFKAIHQLIPRTQALLFDVGADPGELRNLLPRPPAEARPVMQELLGFTQLGQEGYHLSVGDPDPRAWVTVEAATDDRFADVSRFSMDLEESLRFAPDRRRVEYRFLAGDSPR
ncbi:MAG TPA: sulfatase, partial [Vicinamibacteria bacterium]|nr:sulfatase [Vicinamibacteria bacterium]